MTTTDAPVTDTAPAPLWATLADLAAHWGVSPTTATNTTRRPGFPAPLELGPRTRRWSWEEVTSWQSSPASRARARYVPTHARPQFRARPTPAPYRTRRAA